MLSTPILISCMVIISATALHGAQVQVPGYSPVTESVIAKSNLGMNYVFFNHLKLNWMKAHLHCVRYGMQLVDIPTKDVFDWITQNVTVTKPESTDKRIAWTGLNDILNEGQHTYLYNGREHKEFYNFNKLPRDSSGKVAGFKINGDKQHCVGISAVLQKSKKNSKLYVLNNCVCSVERPFICMFPEKKA